MKNTQTTKKIIRNFIEKLRNLNIDLIYIIKSDYLWAYKNLIVYLFTKWYKISHMTNLIISNFKKLKGIQLKWKKTYISMHRIQMKQELFLNQMTLSKI